jgi:hypothetical protein
VFTKVARAGKESAKKSLLSVVELAEVQRCNGAVAGIANHSRDAKSNLTSMQVGKWFKIAVIKHPAL